MEIAKLGRKPGVYHSSEGGGQGLLTITFNSWFWIICPSGFKFFLTSSLLGPGGDGVLPFWFPSFSLSLIPLPLSHSPLSPSLYFCFFFLEGREGRERGRETSAGCLSHSPNQGPGLQPNMYPDQESSCQHFSSQAGAQSTGPHQHH